MYVRDARNNEEVWMLDLIEENNLDDVAFRSREYVVVVDEDTGDRTAFGRYRLHSDTENAYFEFTSLYVDDSAESQELWDMLLSELLEKAIDEEQREDEDEQIEEIFAFVPTEDVQFLTSFGFEETDETALPEALKTRHTLKKDRFDREFSIVQGDVMELEPEDDEEDEASVKDEGEQLSENEVESLASEMGVNTEQDEYKYST
jgi:N-acetylglutamate synthase-like GNAT family acetyltransferase